MTQFSTTGKMKEERKRGIFPSSQLQEAILSLPYNTSAHISLART